jgi:catechol 2,3-dioxygenase
VKSLERELHFYHELLGFNKVEHRESTVALSPTGQQPFQILLTESPEARPRPPRTTGLFHAAIRFPNRIELAKAVVRLSQHGYPIHGASDHLVSEAIYLADPEGNGIELYCDRPGFEWKWSNGEIAMATEPLDVEALLREADGIGWAGIHPQTHIGHIHLNVASLESAEEFYSKQLGFDVTTRSYPGALFMAAGGYHHHIGANIWAGRNAARPPEDSLGLIAFGIATPSGMTQTLSDGDGIQVEMQSI